MTEQADGNDNNRYWLKWRRARRFAKHAFRNLRLRAQGRRPKNEHPKVIERHAFWYRFKGSKRKHKGKIKKLRENGFPKIRKASRRLEEKEAEDAEFIFARVTGSREKADERHISPDRPSTRKVADADKQSRYNAKRYWDRWVKRREGLRKKLREDRTLLFWRCEKKTLNSKSRVHAKSVKFA